MNQLFYDIMVILGWLLCFNVIKGTVLLAIEQWHQL